MTPYHCGWLLLCVGTAAAVNAAEPPAALREALTLHASFDEGFNADFSRGSRQCTVQQGQETVPAAANDDVRILPSGGRHGGALQFTRKSAYRPQFAGEGVLNYNDRNWSTTVSVWLKLDPDRDLEPGYCDPVQIVGDDTKKGFIFLEWSKDHQPRKFRFAIRPRIDLWNPQGLGWEEIPDQQRPMVQLDDRLFTSDAWTHVVFTIANVNDREKPQSGRLYVNGEPRGAIANRDLTLAWDPTRVKLVLGASYVGGMDDLAVFNRALSDEEVHALYSLPGGAGGMLGRD